MRYSSLMSEGSFLRIRERASRLGYNINLLSINYTDNEFQFLTKSQTTPGVIWTQRIRLQKTLTPEEVARMTDRELQYRILDGQLKIFCDCPSFIYWGFAYKAWMRGYGLVRETRRPIVRNPKEQGMICKHLFAIMQAWKFYAPMIAERYKIWYDKNKDNPDVQ